MYQHFFFSNFLGGCLFWLTLYSNKKPLTLQWFIQATDSAVVHSSKSKTSSFLLINIDVILLIISEFHILLLYKNLQNNFVAIGQFSSWNLYTFFLHVICTYWWQWDEQMTNNSYSFFYLYKYLILFQSQYCTIYIIFKVKILSSFTSMSKRTFGFTEKTEHINYITSR